MYDYLLDETVQNYINQNIDKDVSKLALQTHPFPSKVWKSILQQIQSKQKCRKKLPTWFATPNILYPPKISIEQSSSEILALHKSEAISGKSLIDLTGGMGVDTYYFSKKFNRVIHVEIDQTLSELVAHNNQQLNANNTTVYQEDSTKVLQNINQIFDWIYLDPARRDSSQKKVFRLSDCTPDVTQLLPKYFQFSNNVLIKTAPLLDISQGIKDLKFIEKIEIVSLDNEVREILWYLRNNHLEKPDLWVTDYRINSAKQTLKVPLNDQENALYSYPQTYLYEPIPALLKSGCFNFISTYFGVNKIDKNSHLYTSDILKEFMGRCFKIKHVETFSKSNMKAWNNKSANISCRNFPIKPEEIRKKYKIKDGGENYLFFTTVDNGKQKIVINCEKV